MNFSKYVVFATILLLSLSSTSAIVSATSPLQCGTTATSLPSSCVGVSTHGPLVNEVIFSINPSVLPSALSSGSIQAAEWTFTVANFNSITTASIAKGVAAAYNAYGIAFNTIAPYMNNVYFRQAIAYLVDYVYMKGTVLSGGEAGTAEANFLPCTSYPGACTSSSPYTLNPTQAWKDLALAGLIPSTNCAPTYSTTCMKTTTWDVGPGFYGYASPTSGYIALGTCTSTYSSNPSTCVFSPTFYYRNDDPLREEPSVQLCTVDAPMVGLALNCVGIPDTSAGTDIYGPAGLAINCVLTSAPGSGTCGSKDWSTAAVTYDPTTGYNVLPTGGLFNSTVVNGTSSVVPTDGWSMYTYGWGLSAYYTFPYFFFNTAFAGTDNFPNYYSAAMDYYTNALIYAVKPISTCTAVVGSCGAQNAADEVATLLITQLPYIGYFYSTELYAVEAAGWTGYSNLPAYGPSTETGLGYTLINVHPTSSAYGVGTPTSTYKIALHAVADQSGLNPLYHTNWVWQSDIYSSIYDSAFGTPPTLDTTPNAFINWMTVEPTTTMNGVKGIVNYNDIVSAYSGTTGTGANWFNFGCQTLSPCPANNGNSGTGPDAYATTGQPISGGQVITITFRNNLTWTDNVPVTAKDYQFSLYAWDIAGDSGTMTPAQYSLAPPSGLIATELLSATGGKCSVAANTCLQIKMFIGSNSVWNLASVVVDIMPWHILDHFVTSGLSPSPTSALDLTQPSTSKATDAASSSFCPTKTCLISDPTWMQYLPNLEVGSSAYYLSTYKEPPNGAAVITANANWDRAPVSVIATLSANKHSAAFPFKETITQYTYNPKTTTFSYPGDTAKLASHATGYVGINNATVTAQIYTLTGVAVGKPITLKSSTNGVYTATIPTTGLKAGTAYEIVVTGTYHFLGLPRTWYQATGFTFT